MPATTENAPCGHPATKAPGGKVITCTQCNRWWQYVPATLKELKQRVRKATDTTSDKPKRGSRKKTPSTPAGDIFGTPDPVSLGEDTT